ncbi:MAG: hypothetical protein IKN55_11180 [Oscillospiraceae bacterium]|nr:hypothetical protein [Oscillospiraceae bacterium]
MNEKTEKLKALLSDNAFAEKLLGAESAEDVQKMLADNGVEVSLTEVELMGELLEGLNDGRVSREQLEAIVKEGELRDEDLENVAGGSIFSKIADVLFYDTTTYSKTIENSVSGSAQTISGSFKTISDAKIAGCVAGVVLLGSGIAIAVKRRW